MIRRDDLPKCFTLIEILVVIVILVIMSAMAIPMFHGGTARHHIQDAVDRTTQLISLASSMAATEGQTIRLVLENESGKLRLEHEAEPIEQPQVYMPMRLSNMSDIRIDESVRIKRWQKEYARNIPEEEREETWIEFYPDGTAEAAEIVLESESGDVFTILLSSMTARVRVLDYELEEEE